MYVCMYVCMCVVVLINSVSFAHTAAAGKAVRPASHKIHTTNS